MDKERFLRTQWLRMINSDQWVCEQWRSSVDRFISDMWEITLASPGSRFLCPVDASLGFSPDNVEWQFPKIRAKTANKKKAKAAPPKLIEVKERKTRAERLQIKKEMSAAAKVAKRAQIAAELAAWENGSLIKRG